MEFFQELKDLIDAREAANLDHALCGGVALAIRGVPRASQDIDLLVRPADLDRLRAMVRGFGLMLETLPMDRHPPPAEEHGRTLRDVPAAASSCSHSPRTSLRKVQP